MRRVKFEVSHIWTLKIFNAIEAVKQSKITEISRMRRLFRYFRCYYCFETSLSQSNWFDLLSDSTDRSNQSVQARESWNGRIPIRFCRMVDFRVDLCAKKSGRLIFVFIFLMERASSVVQNQSNEQEFLTHNVENELKGLTRNSSGIDEGKSSHRSLPSNSSYISKFKISGCSLFGGIRSRLTNGERGREDHK